MADLANTEVMSSVSGQSSLTSSNKHGHKQEQPTQDESQKKTSPSSEGCTTQNQNHAAAAAAGHARADAEEENLDVNVDRLIVASGFGHAHLIDVAAKSHHLVGRKVTVIHPSTESPSQAHVKKADEQESHTSTVASADGHHLSVVCQMCVSPVISSPKAIDYHTILNLTEEHAKHNFGPKRRKSHHYPRRNQKTNSIVTHYVIELNKASSSAAEKKGVAHGSMSSVSVSAGKLQQRSAAAADENAVTNPPENESEEDDQDDATMSTDPREPVTAIG